MAERIIKYKVRKLLLVLVLFSTTSFSQDIRPFVINSCGQTLQSAAGGLDFNIGEVVIGVAQNNTNVITQGFLQPTNCNFLPSISVNSAIICLGKSIVLTASGATSYSWSPNTGLNSTSGSYVTAIPSTTITYTVTGNNISGCSNTAQSIVTVNPVPTAPTGTDGLRCGTGTVTLSANAVSGQTINWYASSTGGSVLGTGTTFTTPSISSTTIYYAEAVITTTGCVSSRTPVTATVLTSIGVPTVTNNGRCGTGTVTLSATPPSGATVAWFSSTTSTTILSTATSFTTPSIKTSTTYYVESRYNTCVSTRIPVTASVYSVPAAPTAVNGSSCGSGAVNISAVPPSGATIDWWSASTGGNLLSSGNSNYTTPVLNAKASYYAASRLGDFAGCISTTRTTVTATINTLPAAPTASGASRCGAGSVTLTASVPTGQTVAWYAASTGGTPLSTSLSYTTNSLSVDTDFYVEAITTATGCKSATRTKVTVSILTNGPAAPTANNVSRCGPGTVTLTATPPAGATVAWFSAATGGTLLSTANPYTTSSLSASTNNFYVESRLSATCVSATRTLVTATVNPLPNAPTAGAAVSRCGSGSVTVSAVPPDANSTIDWYSASTGGTLLGTGSNYTTSISATTTFYAASRNTTTGCVSAIRSGVTATVNAVPAAPTSITGTLKTCPVSTTGYAYTAKAVTGISVYQWTIPVCATGSSTTSSITIKLPGAGTNDMIYVQSKSSAGCLSTAYGVKITTATTCAACVAPLIPASKSNSVEGTVTDGIGYLKIKVHPNPSQSFFNIELWSSDRVTPIRLKIMDATGRVIDEYDRVNVDGLKALGNYYRNGLYLVEAIQGGQRVVCRMVKGG